MSRALHWAWVGGVVATLVLGLPACEDSGIDPPTDRLYNPVALAVDPDGRYLLVANGDFGLKYTSASVVAVDLFRVGEALGTWPRDGAGERPSTAVEIGGALLAERTVRIGAFAGRMRVHPEHDVAFVTVREDSSVYVLKVVLEGDRLQRIDCGGRAEPLQQCSDQYRLLAHPEGSDAVLREPFGLTLLRRPPTGPGAPAGWALLTSYLRSGDLALFPLQDEDGLPRAGTPQGAYLDLHVPARDLVAHPDGRQIYVSTRDGTDLRSVTLEVDEEAPQESGGELWELQDRGSLGTGPASGVAASETRALLVSPSGERIFVARRHVTTQTGTAPADLVVLHRTLSEFGGVRLDVVGTLRIDDRPIAMAFVPAADLHARTPATPGAPQPSWRGPPPAWGQGEKADAGAEADAGEGLDAGVPDGPADAGVPINDAAAAEDLAPAEDAAPVEDAALPADAGPALDGTSPPDAGLPLDFGAPGPDGGSADPDAGQDAPDPEPARWPDLLFVVCYEGGRVLVFDAEHLVLLGSIEVGKTPYDIAVAPLGGGRSAAPGPGQGYAYISHFRGDRISVVDIDPGSPTWLQKVATIR